MAKLSDLKRLVDAAQARVPGVAVKPAANLIVARPAQELASAAKMAATHPAKKLAPAGTPHAKGEIDLAEAFADVRKLPPSTRKPRASPRPLPIARQSIADATDALAASKYGSEPAPDNWEVGQEHEAEQTYLRRGLSSDILKKLRRGQWSVQSEIDLHGHRIDEAHDALSDFLVDARQHGYRCVRVIHGKGLTSPNRVPVLKGRVRKWLSRWDEVLAYCEAPQHAGGGGAVLVLLRGK